MRQRQLLVVAVLLIVALLAIPLTAGATPPEPVLITLDETFTDTGVVGNFTATGGGVFDETPGTMASVSYKPVGFSPSRDHLVVYTATDRYTTADGSFLVSFEGSCAVIGFMDPVVTFSCGGNWQVNGGTGDYERLKGTGKFSETQVFNILDGTGSGTLESTGRMHTD